MSDTLASFYRGKNIFITGHTGFKGAWLTQWLTAMGANVTGYALAPDATSLHNLLAADKTCRSIIGDLSDYAALKNALTQSKADIVFHMAAQALVRDSYADPVGTFRSNATGTVHLLEAVRESESVQTVINITSDKCYRNDAGHKPFTESDPLGGHDPYAASKAVSEIITASYRQSFLAARGVGVATARAGNVIGGGDFARDRIIPDLFLAARAHMSAELRNPSATRPWQHVLDALHGYLLLAKSLWEHKDAYAKAYNFGPTGAGLSVQQLTESFLSVLGQGQYHIAPHAAKLHEAPTLALDATLARSELGWQPAFTMQETITNTAQWYKQYLQEPQNIQAATYEELKVYRGKH